MNIKSSLKRLISKALVATMLVTTLCTGMSVDTWAKPGDSPSIRVESGLANMECNEGGKFTLKADEMGGKPDVSWCVEPQGLLSFGPDKDDRKEFNAISAGVATITANGKDGKSASITVTINHVHNENCKFTISGNSNVRVEKEINLSASHNGINVDDAVWSVPADNNVATVSDTGVVKGLNVGKVTVTADFGNGKTAEHEITVYPAFTAKADKTELKKGETATISTVGLMGTAGYKSNKPTVASVDNNGNITAISVGEATITVTDSGDNSTATITVNVKNNQVTVNPTTLKLRVGSEKTIEANESSVTWTSDKEDIATVNNGTVKGGKDGTAIITAADNSDSDNKAECTVTVYPQLSAKVGDKTSVSIPEDETADITVLGLMDENKVEYTTSNGDVASVSAGTITAKKEGTATVTVKDLTDGATATVTVNVQKKSKHIFIHDITKPVKDECGIRENDSFTLSFNGVNVTFNETNDGSYKGNYVGELTKNKDGKIEATIDKNGETINVLLTNRQQSNGIDDVNGSDHYTMAVVPTQKPTKICIHDMDTLKDVLGIKSATDTVDLIIGGEKVADLSKEGEGANDYKRYRGFYEDANNLAANKGDKVTVTLKVGDNDPVEVTIEKENYNYEKDKGFYVCHYKVSSFVPPVVPIDITIDLKEKEFTYDGSAHSYGTPANTDVLISAGALVDDDKVVITPASTEVTYVAEGSAKTEVTYTIAITDANGNPVNSSKYNITSDYKTNISIVPRAITVTAGNAEKVYDGTALVYATATAAQKKTESQATNLALTDTCVITTASSSDVINVSDTGAKNVPTNVSFSKIGGGEVHPRNYSITPVNGTLTITQRPIKIKAGNAHKEYDGSPLVYSDSTKTSDTEIIEGDIASTDSETLSQTSSEDVIYVDDNGDKNVPSISITRGGTDVSGNYDITTVNGTLTIDPKAITVTAGNASKVFDGTALTYANATTAQKTSDISITGLVSPDNYDSETVEYTADSTITYYTDGGVANNIKQDTFKIKNGSRDVTNCYTITFNSGNLSILKDATEILITGGTATKVYDGLVMHYADVAEADRTPFTVAASDDFKAKYEVRDVVYKDSDNSQPYFRVTKYSRKNPIISYKIYKKGTNEDVTSQFSKVTTADGYLTLTPKPITIKAEKLTKVYDGTPFSADELKNIKYTVDGLASNDNFASIEFTAADSTTADVSTTKAELKAGNYSINYNNATTKYKVANGATDSYTITIEGGDLEITPRPYVTKAPDFGKVYDGTALDPSYDEIVAAGLELRSISGNEKSGPVSGHTATAFELGTRSNTIDVTGSTNGYYHVTKATKIVDANGNDVTKNYAPSYSSDNKQWVATGKLVVTPRPITVRSLSATQVYNGTALTNPSAVASYKEENDGIVARDVMSVIESASVTNVSKVENKVTVAIMDATDNTTDRSSNYVVTYAAPENNGTLTVTPAKYTVTTLGARKTYDGSPLTAGGSATGILTVDGVADGEIVLTGSRTAVGSSSNTYEIKWNTAKYADMAKNYELETQTLGMLIIDEAPAPAPSPSPSSPSTPTVYIADTPVPTALPAAGVLGARRDATETEKPAQGVLGARRRPGQGVLGERVGGAKTGDAANIAMAMIIMLAALAMCVTWFAARRKRA